MLNGWHGEPVLCLIQVGYCKFPSNEWVDITDSLNIEAYEAEGPKTIIEDFIEAIKTSRDPLVTAEDAVFITRLLEAAYLSADTGQEVFLEKNAGGK